MEMELPRLGELSADVAVRKPAIPADSVPKGTISDLLTSMAVSRSMRIQTKSPRRYTNSCTSEARYNRRG